MLDGPWQGHPKILTHDGRGPHPADLGGITAPREGETLAAVAQSNSAAWMTRLNLGAAERSVSPPVASLSC